MRFLFIILLAALPAAAQQGGADPKKTTIRFAAQVLPPGITEIEMATPETRTEKFTLPLHNLTDPLNPPARAFVLKEAGTEQSLATITLPPAGQKFVILLVIGEKPGFTPVIIPVDSGKFKADQVYAFNSSKKTILGKAGGTKFAIPPATGTIIKPSGAVDGRYYDIALAQRDDTGDRLVSTNRWPVAETSRSYLFFYTDPTTPIVRFRAFSEHVPTQ